MLHVPGDDEWVWVLLIAFVLNIKMHINLINNQHSHHKHTSRNKCNYTLKSISTLHIHKY